MTYIPKSQIAVKVANPGKFQIRSSGKPFEGFYIETSKGIRYAGANNINLGPIIIPIEIPSNKRHGFSIDVKKFDIINDPINKFLSNTLPIPSMKRYPSEDDYAKGFFKRYFSRRINGSGYQEIDEDVFQSIRKKQKIYDHNLYEVGNIKWNLKGNVFKSNTLTLKSAERKYKNISYLFPIFNEFARNPFKNQENLYTEGGELYYSDSTEYIGAYHIHNTMGPMIGALHTEIDHPKLYYTEELPTPSNMSYEEFMLDPLKTSSSPILPVRKNVKDKLTKKKNNTTHTGTSYNCVSSYGPPPSNYQGLLNKDGLTIVSSACTDPGDGTGIYNSKDYGNLFKETCNNLCEGSSGISTNNTSGDISVGCIMSWDANYCNTCTLHDQVYCASNYSTGGGNSYNSGGSYGGNSSGGAWSLDDLQTIHNDYGGKTEEICPCGMFQGVMQYSEDCC